MPTLFRRREVILPTFWGWLLLLGLLVAVAILVARLLGGWLAVSQPVAGASGGAADLIVIEGWLGERELDAAAAYVRERGYQRVLTSGGPILSFSPFASFAERAAHRLREKLPDVKVDAVPTPATKQDRSYASAVWVRDWAQQRSLPVDAIDVYSLGAHARRTRMIYRQAFGDGSRIGIIAGAPFDTDLVHWWRTSEAAKQVLAESLSLVWTQCCFWPAPRGSHEERWAVPLAAPSPVMPNSRP
jgi:hypothetical protein